MGKCVEGGLQRVVNGYGELCVIDIECSDPDAGVVSREYRKPTAAPTKPLAA
jgi:hypothetical protein